MFSLPTLKLGVPALHDSSQFGRPLSLRQLYPLCFVFSGFNLQQNLLFMFSLPTLKLGAPALHDSSQFVRDDMPMVQTVMFVSLRPLTHHPRSKVILQKPSRLKPKVPCTPLRRPCIYHKRIMIGTNSRKGLDSDQGKQILPRIVNKNSIEHTLHRI